MAVALLQPAILRFSQAPGLTWAKYLGDRPPRTNGESGRRNGRPAPGRPRGDRSARGLLRQREQVGVAQAAALQLSGRRLGKRRHPMHPRRAAVPGQAFDAGGEALACVDPRARPRPRPAPRSRRGPPSVDAPTAATCSIASPQASASACSIQSVLTHCPETFSRSSLRPANSSRPSPWRMKMSPGENQPSRNPSRLRFGTPPVA